MNSLKSIVAALVAGATLAVSMPAMAQRGDTGTVQDNQQGSVITGDGNRSSNTNSQNSTTERNGRGTSGDSATIQRNSQNCDVLGNDNTCINKNSQTSTEVRNNGRVRLRR